jgi:isochorismate hydrolase
MRDKSNATIYDINTLRKNSEQSGRLNKRPSARPPKDERVLSVNVEAAQAYLDSVKDKPKRTAEQRLQEQTSKVQRERIMDQFEVDPAIEIHRKTREEIIRMESEDRIIPGYNDKPKSKPKAPLQTQSATKSTRTNQESAPNHFKAAPQQKNAPNNMVVSQRAAYEKVKPPKNANLLGDVMLKGAESLMGSVKKFFDSNSSEDKYEVYDEEDENDGNFDDTFNPMGIALVVMKMQDYYMGVKPLDKAGAKYAEQMKNLAIRINGFLEVAHKEIDGFFINYTPIDVRLGFMKAKIVGHADEVYQGIDNKIDVNKHFKIEEKHADYVSRHRDRLAGGNLTKHIKIRENSTWLGMLDHNGFLGTDFKECLKSEKIKETYFSGISDHGTVVDTAISAAQKGYKSYIVEDFFMAAQGQDPRQELMRAHQNGVEIVSAKSLQQRVKDSIHQRRLLRPPQ